MKLPRPSWVTTEAGQLLIDAVDIIGHRTKLVGGAVRDGLLRLGASDIDFATQFAPNEVIDRLQAAGIKAIPTGIAHGTVTAVAKGLVAEVTTLRRDVSTDGRHAIVGFTDRWNEDAHRRDFTINALYANPVTGVVNDWCHGISDLKAHRVRFIGDPDQRIAEDHLRILRFFRFHARFGAGVPDPAGLAACRAHANDLMALSRERIHGELSKLLAVADPVPVVTAMLEAGILAPVLPEVADLERLARLVAAEAEPCWLRRLAALLPADADVLDDVAVRLRLSRAERKRLVAMAAPPQRDVRAEAYWDGLDAAQDRRLLAGQPADPRLDGWIRPRLPVSGRDLIARGVPAGPEVSRRLGDLERAWVAAGCPADIGPLLDAAAALG